MKSSDFLDRLIERLDRLDPTSVQGYILKLVREKGLLETVFQTLREGVIIIDRELKIHYVNNAAIQLLGLPADIGMTKTLASNDTFGIWSGAG